MKKFTHYFMAAMLTLASAGFMACEEENNNPTTYTESALFSFYYQGQKIAAGDTVEAIPTSEQIRIDFANMDLMIDNKTGAEVQVKLKAEKIEGPAAADHIELCFDGACREGNCPWITDLFTLVAGQGDANKVTYDYTPSAITQPIVYRLTVGKGGNMEEPQVIFIKHNV